jgi:translation initiation factor 5B
MLIRSPICTVVGHVDHGKSSVLDYIRGSNIISREAGAITQAIGASIVPLDTIKKKAGQLLKQMGINIEIPSLLFIDTPGHAAFTNLRKRGGNLADIAIVVIDINEGIMPQTKEAIEILINYKTPFIVALNKIDLIPGFKISKNPLKQVLDNQSDDVQQIMETKLYEIVGKLNEMFNLQAERFDRVDDFTKQIAMIPISAKEGIGIAELLMMIMGLAQRFLKDKLMIDPNEEAKGTILEVKTEKGLGKVLDVILYDGHLRVNDTIVIGTLNGSIITKVKALFVPLPLIEIMDKKAKFKSSKEVTAAIGVRISAKDIDDAISGMPIRGARQENLESVKDEIQKEIEEVTLDTDNEGIIVKADSLGSLEALMGILKSKNVNVVKASVGEITKSDVIDANASKEKSPFYGVILGFNTSIHEEAQQMVNDYGISVITSNVIYHLLDDYDKWIDEQKIKIERKKMEALPPVAKIEFLSGYVFRQNNPAVIGVEVLNGSIKSGMPIMKDGKHITEIKSIQKENKSVSDAKKKDQVAVSLPNVTVGRQIKEGDIFYTFLAESEFREYKKFKEYLTGDEKTILKEIADIMRKDNPVWGV